MIKENKTFEESLKELDNISKKLESEDITLDEAIALFEEGIKLSNECADKLKTAKQKIERITDDGSKAND